MQDGVIKYQNIHQVKTLLYPTDLIAELEALNVLRTKLFDLGYIGLAKAISYGNLSLCHTGQIFITASDSSKERVLDLNKYTLIQKAELNQNKLYSQGLYAPSSEAMTHLAIYASQTEVSAVIHIHSEFLFAKLKAKNYPHTAQNIAYGTVDMALATQELVHSLGVTGVFYMAGHEEGIIAYAPTMFEAYNLIINL